MIPKSNGRVHASVIELSPGCLITFMRYREAKRIRRSEFFDWGKSWSEPVPIPLPNSNSSISAVKMKNGRVIVTYNPTPAPGSQSDKTAWPELHYSVAVAPPEGGGKTFPLIRWMERSEGFVGDENCAGNRRYEYLHLVQSKDGMLHLAYAARTREGIKYLRFHEEGVAEKKHETTGLYNSTTVQSR